MHPNPIFRKESEERNLNYAKKRAFGSLTLNGDPAPMISHIPFQLSEDGKRLEAHLVRSNPIARHLRDGEATAVMAVWGPDAYISPDWYGVENQVPTWNYVAVHLHGTVRLLHDDALLPVLERLSEAMEKQLLRKSIWHHSKMDAEALSKMMRQIVPIEMDVTSIDGTWKLGQNKSADARSGAAAGLENSKNGLGILELAQLMREVEE